MEEGSHTLASIEGLIERLESNDTFNEIYYGWLISLVEYLDDRGKLIHHVGETLDDTIRRIVPPLLIDPKAYWETVVDTYVEPWIEGLDINKQHSEEK